MDFTRAEVNQAKTAYEQDRREHKYWQPHWEELSHSDHIHWIITTRGNKIAQPVLPAGTVVVVG